MGSDKARTLHPHWLPAIGLLLGMTVLLATGNSEAAVERTVLGIEPATIQQGDTVLLTITGENLPTGTVIVEFFPQQIALLDILASSAEEILAQVKVPSLAPPGLYNVLIYNHLGEDVFGEALLSISSDVITPVFNDYEPKQIGEATEGFALLLLAEAITPGVVDHLSMRWRKADRQLSELTTTFSQGGRGQILCAVTGAIPGGVLQGRIYLNDVPIYMVEITNTTAGGMIVGQQQIKLGAGEPPYAITLLGTGFSAGFLSDLNIELSSADITSRAREINLIDASQFTVVFSGPLPAGKYTLNVMNGGQPVYSGELELAELAVESETLETDEIVSAEIIEEVEAAVPDEGTLDTLTELVAGTPPVYDVYFKDIAPRQIAPGPDPASFAVSAAGLTPEIIEGLQISLRVGEAAGNLLFVGSGSENLTCLFAPPVGGWLPGKTGQLLIEDPQGVAEPFVADLVVGEDEQISATAGTMENTSQPVVEATPAEPEIETAVDTIAGWDIIRAVVTPGADTSVLTIEFDSPGEGMALDQLGGSFTLLPAAGPQPVPAAGWTLNGALSFSLNAAGHVTGSAMGTFTSGDLLVSMGSGAAPLELMTYELVVDEPTAISPSANLSISVLDQACLIDARGLEFSLLVRGDLADPDAIASVTLESDNLLFNINLANFRQTATVISTADPRLVSLRLDRLPQELDELAFQIMTDELIEADKVTMVFSWAALGYSISEDITFSSKKPGVANDILM